MKKNDKPAFNNPTTVICKDTIIHAAKLTSTSSVQISGQFIGDLDIQASLVIGETGAIKGNIKADFVLIAGEVIGNVEVSRQLHITSTGKTVGDITAGTMVIDEGAQMDGSCKMVEKHNEE